MTYPETVTLARTLATLPNRPHHDTDDALNLIAHRLRLARLASNANDPLRVFLTHTPLTSHTPLRSPERAQPPTDAPPHLRESQDQSHTTTGPQAKHPNNQTERTHQSTPTTPERSRFSRPESHPKNGTPDQSNPTP